MREIKFRGKAVDSGEWVYGYLLLTDDRAFIHSVRDGLDFGDIDFGYGFIQVDPKTVGQFTGLLDKNGKKIYEGDIAKFIGRFLNQTISIIFDIISARFIGWCEEDKSVVSPQFFGASEVIGNIHENPELLK